MRAFNTFLLLALLLAGCQASPSESEQTAVMGTSIAIAAQSFLSTSQAETEAVQNQITPSSTFTPQPTQIPTSTQTVRSVEELQADFIEASINILENGEGLEDIETVNVVRFNGASFEIEIHTIWASRDRQPIVSYEIISFFSIALEDWTDSAFRVLFNSDNPVIHITSYSTDGDYRYQSETDIETLRNVANKSISYEEWVEASGAGFK